MSVTPPTPLPPSRYDFDPAEWPDDDCVVAGADLLPPTIVDAYRHGAFPMPQLGRLLWWSPMLRGVLEPGSLRVTRSMRRSARHLDITVDTAFEQVIDACADPRRPDGWITAEMRAAYVRLHEMGWAHSVEAWDPVDGTLAGGLYGLWFGDLDPVFQFSILSGAYMVLMALLGGVRHLYGPLLGAVIVGYGLEYSKLEYGDSPLHLVFAGLLLGVVVMFMPDGVIPAVTGLIARVRGTGETSIREVTAAELRDEREADVRQGSPPDGQRDGKKEVRQ